MSGFKYIDLNIKDRIATVSLNNPGKLNSLNETMWEEIRSVFIDLHSNDVVNVCVIKGNGKHFSSGIDINYLISVMEKTKVIKPEEQKEFLYKTILQMQEAFNAISDCQKPVIAAIHGLCIGAGVDLIAACDIRYALYAAHFNIMETKLGIVADMGTLQRLPRIIGDGDLKELALTSKIFTGIKGKRIGLLNKCFITKKQLYKESFKLAKLIASHPTEAVQGTKETINYSRDHNVADGLEYIARLNSVLLNSPQMESRLDKILSMLKK